MQALASRDAQNSEQVSAQDAPEDKALSKAKQNKGKEWRFMVPYRAEYALFMDGDKVGKASRFLKKSDDHWRIETDAKASKFIISIKTKEFSEFEIADNKLRPLHFFTSSKITFQSARTVDQRFDWQAQQEKGSKGKKKKTKWERPIEPGSLDRMSHSLQLRADILAGKKQFEYPVSYKGKTKRYAYRKEGIEILDTRLGKLKTLKFSRGNPEDGIFTFWLSPDFNYLPLKIAQIENDKPDIVMEVLTIKYE